MASEPTFDFGMLMSSAVISDQMQFKIGGDHLINASPRNDKTGVPRFRDDVNAITGGRGIVVVFDTVRGVRSNKRVCDHSLSETEWSSSAERERHSGARWRKERLG